MSFGLNLSRIQDQYARDNFAKIDAELSKAGVGGLTLLTGTCTGNQTGFAIPHNLKLKPTDAILTSAIWSGTVGSLVIKYSSFDEKNFYMDVAGQGATDTVSIRVLIGRIT